MTDQHRATPEDWGLAKSEDDLVLMPADASLLELRARIEALEARDHENANCWDMARSGMGALRERIEALEAAQLEQAESNRFCTDAIVRRVEALEAAHEAPAMTELRAASAEVRPAASEIFPVEYADSNGEGIRIIMEPADETGRVCWVVRNSRRVSPIREFPTPEAAYAAHQVRPTVKDSLTDAEGLDERDPECVANWPDCYEGGYDPSCCRFPKSCSCEVRRPLPGPDNSSAGLTSSPGGLVEQLAALITSATTSRGAAQDVLREVVAWLEARGSAHWLSVAVLNREVNRG
jgi:hypothetical protein